MKWALILVLLLTAVSGTAQNLDIDAWPDGTVDLSGSNAVQWHVQAGDNIAWAQTGFDDRA